MKGDCLKSGSSSGKAYLEGKEFSSCSKTTVSASLFCCGVASTFSPSREVITGKRGAGLAAEPVELCP